MANDLNPPNADAHPPHSENERQAFSVLRRAIEKTRLMVEGGGMVSTSDVLGKLNAALTEYGKGELGVALSLVKAAAGAYQGKLSQWEMLVRQREESVKQRSVQKFRQVQSVHNPIRTNTRQVPSNFQFLADSLDERIKNEGKTLRANVQATAEVAAEPPPEPPPPSPAEVAATLLKKTGIRALVDIIGPGLKLTFTGAKLKPTFQNAAVREQVWQNRALVLVVTWSNGNRVVDAGSAPLTLHLWVIPKTVKVMRDLQSLEQQPLLLESQSAGTTENVLFTDATGRSPATPYNKEVKEYISGKTKDLRDAADGDSITAVFGDSLYTDRPFKEGCEETFFLKLPEVWTDAGSDDN